jgi:ABC-2 type transport system permease protein
MNAVLAIFGVSYRQLMAGKRTYLLGALALIPAVVMYVGASTMTDTRAFEFFHEGPLGVLVFAVAPIVALVLATSALGEERRQGTMSFLVIRPIPRWAIIAAKGMATWAATSTVVGAAGLAAAAAFGLRTGSWETVVPTLALVGINNLIYVALFMPLGFLFKRAMLFGLGYVFIWDNGIANVPGLSPLSVYRIGLSAYIGILPGSSRLLDEPVGNVAQGAGGALAKGLVLAVLGVLALTVVLRRRDLV